ncbi:hypothetical protein AHF37_01160 [Paragonimus kellicotti]|nr:hypothetical protein AHF37_01160 [Paragonimus kellicotti]
MDSSAGKAIGALLERMVSSDTDYRFMAMNDLVNELQADAVRLDSQSEKKVVTLVLRLLRDPSGEVQSLAVKSLGPLTTKVKDQQVITIVKELVTTMEKSGDEQLRGVCSIGLKTVMSALPAVPDNAVVQLAIKESLVPLLNMVIAHSDDNVRVEACEVLTEMINNFGSHLTNHHLDLLECMLFSLSSPQNTLRKRASQALGSLTWSISPKYFASLLAYLLSRLRNATIFVRAGATTTETGEQLETLISNHALLQRPRLTTQLKQSATVDMVKTLLQCLNMVGRHMLRAPNQLRPVLRLLTIILRQPGSSDSDMDDVHELAIQTLETLVRFCPRVLLPMLPELTSLLCERLIYDPNYDCSEPDDDDGDRMAVDDGDADLDFEDGDEGDDDYSDDEDSSWKVRRAAARALEAIILTYPEKTSEFYFSLPLSLFNLVYQGAPGIQHAAFMLNRDLALALPGHLGDHLNEILSLVHAYSLDPGTSNTVKVDMIDLVVLLLSTHSPDYFRPNLEILLQLKGQYSCIRPLSRNEQEQTFLVLWRQSVSHVYDQCVHAGASSKATSDRLPGRGSYNREEPVRFNIFSCFGTLLRLTRINPSASTAFGVAAESFVPVFRPNDGFPQRTATLNAITQSSVMELKSQLKDPTSAVFIGQVGDLIGPSLDKCLEVIYCRLKSELTRLSALFLSRLLGPLNGGGLLIDSLSPPTIPSATLHRDALPSLAQCIAELLAELPTSPMAKIVPGSVSSVNVAVDRLIAAVQNSNSSSAEVFLDLLILGELGRKLDLSNRLDLREIFLSCLSAQTFVPLPEDQSASPRSATTGSTLAEQVKPAAALGLGRLVVGQPETLLPFLVDRISEVATGYLGGGGCAGSPASMLTARQGPQQQQHLYHLLQALKEVLINLAGFNTTNALKTHLDAIWSLLIASSGLSEEGTRSVVAECLGRLILVSPRQLINRLRQQLNSPEASSSPLVRCTLVSAVKFILIVTDLDATAQAQLIGQTRLEHMDWPSGQGSVPLPSDPPVPATVTSEAFSTVLTEVDAVLRSDPPAQPLLDFLSRLADPDILVRRAALSVLNTAVHHRPSLVRPLLNVPIDAAVPHSPTVLKLLYAETAIRPELIREVEMGPFKHKEDDGLDLRKYAFECMSTLLETCLDKLVVAEFLEPLIEGLKDHTDIKLLSYQMLQQISCIRPLEISAKMDALAAPLKTVLLSKPKEDWVKQEMEKMQELSRCAICLIARFKSIDDIDKNRSYSDLVRTIEADPSLKAIYMTVLANGPDSSPVAYPPYKRNVQPSTATYVV